MTIKTLDSERAVSMDPALSDTRPNDKDRDMLMAELKASQARESELVRSRDNLLERQKLLTQEFEHRLVNGLQIVASLLSLQSRSCGSPEAAAQLSDAALRVAAISRVHRQLHRLDREEKVDFRLYIQQLCSDLSALLLHGNLKRRIFVSGTDGYLPVAIAIPLGFIVTELVTNSAKYTDGNIVVHVAEGPDTHSLSVSDEGFGLPDGFNPAHSKGLGMNIIRSLVKQIGGTLQFSPGKYGRGTSVTIRFALLA